MAKDYKPEDIMFPEQHIVLFGDSERDEVELYRLRHERHCRARAAGCADGLKPVHRRILYAMYEDGLTSDKPFKKSATCVGGRAGPLSPPRRRLGIRRARAPRAGLLHALPARGRPRQLRLHRRRPPPRPTDTRRRGMSRISDEMLRDIEKDTVDWDPNFDESRREPRVLPRASPTCSSTARAASPSAWQRISRRTTSPRS